MGVTRRDALKSTAAGAGIATLAAAGSAPAHAQGKGRTFVLVHGSWHGGWCWARVRDILAAKGHRVLTPTLTGLADRSHLLASSINMDTHIADVVNLYKWEDLESTVLVGHSYGGWPISGAVEKIGAQVASIVFLDAFLPENGQKLLDITPERLRGPLLEAAAKGEPGRPIPPATSFQVKDPKDVAWVQAKLTMQPVGSALQPIVLTGAREKVAKKTYIRAAEYPNPLFDSYVAKLRADPSWKTYELKDTGHDVMVDAPDRLAKILEDVA